MRIDPTFYALISEAFEKSLNDALQYDPGTRAKLRELDGRSLAIVIDNMNLLFGVLFQNDSIQLSIQPELNDEDLALNDVVLRGELSDLVTLISKKHSLANSGVEVRGRVGLLESVQNIAKDIEIDWEDALYDKLGPILSQPLIMFLKQSYRYVKEVSANSKQIVSEYIEHESELGLHREEFKLFSEQVDSVRSHTDRLQARLRKLQAKMEQRHS